MTDWRETLKEFQKNDLKLRGCRRVQVFAAIDAAFAETDRLNAENALLRRSLEMMCRDAHEPQADGN